MLETANYYNNIFINTILESVQTKAVNATKGGAVANKKSELEIVKVIENPMAELESLDEREKDIVDVVKKSVKNLLEISQMRMFNEKEEGRMVGAHILMPVVVRGVPIELVEIANELNATVAVCHDDITEQMGITISWG